MSASQFPVLYSVNQAPTSPSTHPSTIHSPVDLLSPFSHPSILPSLAYSTYSSFYFPLFRLYSTHCSCSRIYEILPQRIQQWQQSPCIAEEHGKKLLERIRREQQSARTRLQEMERRFHELESIIARAKQQAVREDEEVSKRGRGSAGPNT